MIKTLDSKQKGHERGNILIVCVVIIMILTSLGIYALNSTTMELAMSASDRREAVNFQNAETGLRFAISHFKLIYENDDRNGNVLYNANADGTGIGIGGVVSVVDGVLTISEVPSGAPLPLRDMTVGQGGVVFSYADTAGTPVARIEIRDVARVPLNIAALSTFANSVPAFPHLSDPPPGYDSSQWDGRNYVITSTAIAEGGAITNTTVQCGIKTAAQKDSVAHLRTL